MKDFLRERSSRTLSWFAAGLFVGIALFVVLVCLLFLGFGFNV